jgi:hypothetical protein
MISGAEKLVRFYAEGRRQRGALSGIEGCLSIEQLVVVDCPISGIAPLRGLNMLSELRLMAAPPSSSHENIDLADLADSRLGKLWISNASEIEHIEVLLEMPLLRDVRLIGSHLKDADQRVLDLLSERVRVDII